MGPWEHDFEWITFALAPCCYSFLLPGSQEVRALLYHDAQPHLRCTAMNHLSMEQNL